MITLYSGLVVKQPLVETLIPHFEAETGMRVETVFEPTTVLLQRVADGERPDLLLGVADAVRGLAETGAVDGGTAVDIAVSSVGFARLPHAAAPTDDSAQAFLDYLLDARAVAYSLSGASGLHFMQQLRQRDLLERIDERAVRFETGLTAEAVVDGRAETAIQQLSELLSVPGPHVVAPIPHELQAYARFAVGARPGAPEAAARFIELLQGPLARRSFESVGLVSPDAAQHDSPASG